MSEGDRMMSVKKKLLLAAVLLLDAAGLVFLCLSIFGNEPGTRYLAIGLLCIAAGSVINVIQLWKRKKERDSNEQ